MADRAALAGQLVSGLGEAAGFTQTEWARNQFIALVGIDPYPGTVNLVLTEQAEIDRWQELRVAGGILLPAPDPAFCDARLFRVTLNEAVAGAIVFPHVADYPADKVEVIAAVGVRAALGLNEGDRIRLDIDLGG